MIQSLAFRFNDFSSVSISINFISRNALWKTIEHLYLQNTCQFLFGTKDLLQFLQARLGTTGRLAQGLGRAREAMVMMGIVIALMGICQPCPVPIPFIYVLQYTHAGGVDFGAKHMALGIVSDDIFENELGSSNITPDAIIIQHRNNGGRPEGTENVPDSIRKIIGDTAIESGRTEALEVANFFGVSDSSVSAYSKGATSTSSYDEPKTALLNHLNVTKQRIAKRAVNRLNKTFDALTDDKFSAASGPELATMAKSFAAIVKDMSPMDEKPPVAQVQFVIHTPPITKEEKFTTIVVNDRD
jgi:predicted transcriptional regulator